VLANFHYGGMEKVVAEFLRHSDRDQFDHHVLTFDFLGHFAQGLEKFARLHQLEPQSRWSMVWPHALEQTIRRISPHVVHSHSGVWHKVSLAAHRAGVPCIVHTEHGRLFDESLLDRFTRVRAARRTSAVVAVSRELADHLKTTVVTDPTRLHVITNGVRTDWRGQPNAGGDLRRELGVASHQSVIGSVGRLEPVKGYDVMVYAFAELKDRWPHDDLPALVVAGDGSERKHIETRIQHLNLERDVHLLGWRDDIDSLHAAFDLFTMSSRSEGTSMSLLHAMNAQLCPVVTAVGGNEAVLGPKLAHRLVEPDNPRALARAWLDALEHPRQRQADAGVARQQVCDRFGIVRTVRQYEDLYLSLLGRR